MAVKIPTVDALGGRPVPNAIAPVVRQDNSAPDRAMQNFGKVVSQIGERIEAKQDEAAFQDAQVQYNDFEQETLYDPETGAAAKKGKDAFDLAKTVPQAYDRFRDKLMGGLTSNRQREFIGRLAESRRAQAAQWAAGHVAKERDSYEKGAAAAAEDSAIERVGSNPALFDQELLNQSLAKTARLRKLGRPPEEIERATADLKTSMRGRVVDGMIARGEYDGARAYYQANAKDFGDKSDEYGRRTAGAIEHEQLVQERRVAMAERDTRRNASSALEASDPTLPIDVVLRDQLPAINAQPGLRDSLERRQRERLQGLEVQTDPREKERLRTLMGKDPQGFLQADLTTSYPKLSIADRDYFENQQKAFADPSKHAQVATEEAQLRKYGDLMKLPGGDKGDELRGLFRQAYDGERAALMKANGNKEPNYEEREAMLKRITLPFTREHLIFRNESVPLFKAKPGEDLKVPETDREQIIEAYKASNSGREPSGSEIVYYYQLKATR